MVHLSKTASQWCSEDAAATFALLPLESQTMSNLYTLQGMTSKALPKDSRSANLKKISKLFKCQVVALEDLPEEARVENIEKITTLNWHHIKALGVLPKAERASNIDKIAELNDEQAQIPELLNKDARVKFLEKAKEFQRYHIDVLKSLEPSERNASFEKIIALTAAQALIIVNLPENKVKYIDNISNFDWETAKTFSLLPVELRIELLENNEIPQLNQYQNEALEALPPEKRADNIENIKILEHYDCAAMANLGRAGSEIYLKEAISARHHLKDTFYKYQRDTSEATVDMTSQDKLDLEATLHCKFDIPSGGTKSDQSSHEHSDQSSEKKVTGNIGKELNQDNEYGTDL